MKPRPCSRRAVVVTLLLMMAATTPFPAVVRAFSSISMTLPRRAWVMQKLLSLPSSLLGNGNKPTDGFYQTQHEGGKNLTHQTTDATSSIPKEVKHAVKLVKYEFPIPTNLKQPKNGVHQRTDKPAIKAVLIDMLKEKSHACAQSVQRKNQRHQRKWPIPERPHERALLLVYTAFSTGALTICAGSKGSFMGLHATQMAIAWTWSSMILAISFLEPWVRFRAPFLRPFVAVDVGRHIFAALNAVEMALCVSFWIGSVLKQCGAGEMPINVTCRSNNLLIILPALCSAVLLFQVISVSPRLSLRAKAKILTEGGAWMIRYQAFSNNEMKALDVLTQDVNYENRQRSNGALPSSKWHKLYAGLEVLKVLCLKAFVVVSMLQILQGGAAVELTKSTNLHPSSPPKISAVGTRSRALPISSLTFIFSCLTAFCIL
jgi:hypothetical protein